MSTSEEPLQDEDDRLMEQLEACGDLRKECRHRTALRLALEARRAAQAEQRLMPYLHALFEVMNLGQSLLEPQTTREAALQAIALLESPERARRFQSDYFEPEYEYTVGWMSACAYDNLAIGTAMMNGYNSPGMQGIIAEGIHICQRTGKLRCIACFRAYATDVHMAADDLEMALHHARAYAGRIDPENDRRWVAAKDESKILLLQGHLSAAWDAAMHAMELVPTYHSPLSAVRDTRQWLRTIGLLTGRDASKVPSSVEAPPLPREESTEYDLREDVCAALAASLEGKHEAAIERLAMWDRQLTTQRCLTEWFEVRLRLVAAYRLAGQETRAQSLAKQLEAKAQGAFDYLTLRRLKQLMDAATAPGPLPLAAAGDTAKATIAAALPAPAPAKPVALTPLVEQFTQRLHACMREEKPPTQLAEDLLAVTPSQVGSDDEAARLMHLLSIMVKALECDARVWEWTQAMAAPHPQSGIVLNLKATMADMLHGREGSPLASRFSVDEIGEWFRRSLDLVPDGAGCFYRAAQFYMGTENWSEAERCLARSFRLDRSNPRTAMQLSNAYARTERQTDALAVLDMCLREGEAYPPLLWEAGMLAVTLGRNESALSYLDAFAQKLPGQPWTQYYRARALLGLSRPQEASQAIEQEPPSEEGSLHIIAVRSAVVAALGQADELRRQLGEAMQMPLYSVTNLTTTGMTESFQRLWQAAQSLPEDDPVRAKLAEHLIMTAMTPEDMLEALRKQGMETEGLAYFMCLFVQPLDERWATWPGRLAGQEHWTEYGIRYGVLAADQEQAVEMALKMQHRCYPLPPRVEEVARMGEDYTDCPGITMQSLPEPIDAADAPAE